LEKKKKKKMPLCCFGEKEPLFGRSIEDLLENDLTDHSNREMIPKEIQQFVNYLSEKNGIYIYYNDES